MASHGLALARQDVLEVQVGVEQGGVAGGVGDEVVEQPERAVLHPAGQGRVVRHHGVRVVPGVRRTAGAAGAGPAGAGAPGARRRPRTRCRRRPSRGRGWRRAPRAAARPAPGRRRAAGPPRRPCPVPQHEGLVARLDVGPADLEDEALAVAHGPARRPPSSRSCRAAGGRAATRRAPRRAAAAGCAAQSPPDGPADRALLGAEPLDELQEGRRHEGSGVLGPRHRRGSTQPGEGGQPHAPP